MMGNLGHVGRIVGGKLVLRLVTLVGLYIVYITKLFCVLLCSSCWIYRSRVRKRIIYNANYMYLLSFSHEPYILVSYES